MVATTALFLLALSFGTITALPLDGHQGNPLAGGPDHLGSSAYANSITSSLQATPENDTTVIALKQSTELCPCDNPSECPDTPKARPNQKDICTRNCNEYNFGSADTCILGCRLAVERPQSFEACWDECDAKSGDEDCLLGCRYTWCNSWTWPNH